MKRILFVTACIMLSALAMAQNAKKVAVMEVKTYNGVTQMHAVMIRGGLETAVGNTPGYEVYDRSNFESIMQEQNFQRSGAVKDSDIKRLGEMAGVQYIIVPEAVVDGKEIYINVKMLDVETGKFGGVLDRLCSTNSSDIRQSCAELGEELFSKNVSVTGQTASSNGIFSASPDKKVKFSKGNLQYQPSTNTWRFAEHQWDIIGKDNQNIKSPDYGGWIDLFGWGTGNDPTKTIVASRNNYNNFEDWGDNNISNGGNDDWYTLSINEWAYVFAMRSTNSGIRFAKAIVNEVYGVILLPDDWSAEKYNLNYTNNASSSFDGNIISQSEWVNNLEPNGAVFLPVAGYREGVSVYGYGNNGDFNGCYWSNTCPKNDTYKEMAYDVNFKYATFMNENNLNVQASRKRSYGCSVRLVSTVK